MYSVVLNYFVELVVYVVFWFDEQLYWGNRMWIFFSGGGMLVFWVFVCVSWFVYVDVLVV